MRNLLAFFSFNLILLSSAQEIDWAQPPVECLEESVPRPPRKKCLDLSQVASASFDFPAGMSAKEKKLWTTTYAKDLRICRSLELVRRGNTSSGGGVSAATYQYAWMRVQAMRDYEAKRASVLKASRETKIPQSLLAGALLQESYLANLGIVNDGGNYSCGMGQLNPQEWCGWMQSLPEAEQKRAGWPAAAMKLWQKNHPGKSFCNNTYLSLSLMQPFYKRALAQLNGLPEYRLEKKHFQGFSSAEIIQEFPAADSETQNLRHATLKAFIDSCNSVEYAIRGKAYTLAQLFNAYAPTKLKNSQKYAPGETFSRQCKSEWQSPYYPLHTGWLLAIAIYNTGPRAMEMLRHYDQWTVDQYNNAEYWATSKPQDLVDTLYWSGKYNPQTDLIEYQPPGLSLRTIPWYRQCITQRHVARTMNNVVLAGSNLAQEWSPEGCPQSIFDPNGVLVQTKVPEARRLASGVRD